MADSIRPDAESPSSSAFASDLPLDARPGYRTLTLRDDRLDFPGFADAAASCRRRRARLRLVDQGRFSSSELEWLAEAGTDLYTSDKAGRGPADLVLVRKSGARGNARTAFFQHGPIDDPILTGLREVGRAGVDIHLSNLAGPRDLDLLADLAWDCVGAGSVFAYQHHGPLAAGLEALAGRGAWIHVSTRSFASAPDAELLGACARAARARGGNVVLHIETHPDPVLLADTAASGAFLVFTTPVSDYRSPLRSFEDAAARRRLPDRAYYLFLEHVL
jgi:hypothetical protein